ncbi:DedA family protein [Pseudonocardia sp. MH-G8]|uniref:DedA family protein n=1 Tax=Pseudonocardia sp. MH-G8 TaxID=1854588 RepID=UPI001303F746|nr:VTT domain-containing protein [Pseudonocardia sp. MH-G8]
MITEWLDAFFAMIDAVPAWQLYAVVGLLLVLETTVLIGLVTPGEVVLLAAATTVGSAGEYAALAAVAAGSSLIGQTGGYLLGRKFGGRIRASWAGRKVGESNWVRAEAVLRGGTGRAVVGSRFMAVAHSLVPVLAGTLRMPLGRYARYTALGAITWGLVYVGLGSAASLAIRHSAHLLGPVVTCVVVVAVAAALGVRAVRKRRRRAAGEPVDDGVAAVPITVGTGGGDLPGGGSPGAQGER